MIIMATQVLEMNVPMLSIVFDCWSSSFWGTHCCLFHLQSGACVASLVSLQFLDFPDQVTSAECSGQAICELIAAH